MKLGELLRRMEAGYDAEVLRYEGKGYSHPFKSFEEMVNHIPPFELLKELASFEDTDDDDATL